MKINRKKFEKIAQEMIKNIKEDQKRLDAYFNSEQFRKDLSICHHFFYENQEDKFQIDNEEMIYFPGKYPISHSTLNDMVEAVHQNTKNKDYIHEHHNPFPHSVIEYDGLIFRIINGQGTVLQICEKKRYNEWQKEMPERMEGIKDKYGEDGEIEWGYE